MLFIVSIIKALLPCNCPLCCRPFPPVDICKFPSNESALYIIQLKDRVQVQKIEIQHLQAAKLNLEHRLLMAEGRNMESTPIRPFIAPIDESVEEVYVPVLRPATPPQNNNM